MSHEIPIPQSPDHPFPRTKPTPRAAGHCFQRARIAKQTLLLALALTLVTDPAGAVDVSPGWPGTQISTPVIVNLYWDSDVGTWDTHNGPQGTTIERIDHLTRALVESNYLDGLVAYNVTGWSLAPSLVLGQLSGCASMTNPLPANTQNAHNLADSAQFQQCIQTALSGKGIDGSNVVLNIIMPPQIVGGNDNGLCGHPSVAYHDSSVGWVKAATFVPVNCNQSVALLFRRMTHEMVEAITDPDVTNGYRNHDPTDPTGLWQQEIGDLCQGGSSSVVQGSNVLQAFFPSTINAAVSTYWWNNKACQPIGATGINHYISDGVDKSLAACGRGKNMELSLVYWTPQDNRGPLPWDLTPNSTKSMAQGKTTMYASATLPQLGGGTFTVGSQLRNPTADGVGFGWIEYAFGGCNSWSPCLMYTDFLGFDTDVQLKAGDPITVTLTDPATGLDTSFSTTAPAASNANLWLVPASKGPNNESWVIFGDGTQLQGQVLDSCDRFSQFHGDLGPGPIEGESVSGKTQASWPVVDFNHTQFSAVSDSNGSFQTPFVTDSAGLQTVTFSVGNATLYAAVHPAVTSINPTGGLNTGGEPVTIYGGGFVPGPRTTVAVIGYYATVNAANVVVAADGKSLTYSAPDMPGGVDQVVVYVDGVASLPLSFYSCEPITSCYYKQACNTTINDGCNVIQCGACAGGATCNANHNCCPSGMEPDGTGGCECAPARPCGHGSDWDPSTCRCIRAGAPGTTF
jgi:hypothetical protein